MRGQSPVGSHRASQLSNPSNSQSFSQPPPPLSLSNNGSQPVLSASCQQILQTGASLNSSADAISHKPRIESLMKLGKESEATWLQIGATAETLVDWERALIAYESALRHNAYSIIALSQIATICRAQEDFKKAAEYFGRIVGIKPESGETWGALGHCYLMIDDLKKAYSSYQQALYYMPNPQEPKLWYGIGILYDRYGSLEHAEEAFSSVIRMDPGFEKANEIFFRLGIIYKQQRKSAQSLECFRYILQNPPRPLTEIDIWFQIGHVYEQQKDFIAAKDSYEKVLAENPAHAKVLQQLGGLYHRSRAPFYNPEVSVTILTKSLESDANDPFSWYLLGRAYMTTNNFGKAYEAYQQAVYRDGKNPAFWCSIGVLYYNINQFHDALDAYSRAIRIHPYLAEVWFNLGALYESCNDQMTDAIDAYQRTLQLDPTNSLVSNRLREIRDHQTNGTTLSSPPTPKDISPASLSWNYATNTGGAPSHLTQTGLGSELSPTTANPIRANPSPVVTGNSRFDGPPTLGPSNGRDGIILPPTSNSTRPRSTDPYRGHNGIEERRRQSGGQAAGSPNGASPRTNYRNSNSSSISGLPQIKAVDSANRGSPPVDRLRRSPPSPRTQSNGADQLNYSNPTSHYPHPPPSNREGTFSRLGDNGGPSVGPGPERERERGEMEWERGRGNGNGRNSAPTTLLNRRSPPNAGPAHPSNYSHNPSGPSPASNDSSRPPAHAPFERHNPTSTSRSDPPPTQPPASSNQTHQFHNSNHDANLRRFEEEEGFRRGVSLPRSGACPSSTNSNGSENSRVAMIPAFNGGNQFVSDNNIMNKPARAGTGSPVTTKKKRGIPSEGGAATSAPKRKAPTRRDKVVPEKKTEKVLVREVNEDYDEGVDALLGLAGGKSGSPRTGLNAIINAALPPSTTPTPLPSILAAVASAAETELNASASTSKKNSANESVALERNKSLENGNSSAEDSKPSLAQIVAVEKLGEKIELVAPSTTESRVESGAEVLKEGTAITA